MVTASIDIRCEDVVEDFPAGKLVPARTRLRLLELASASQQSDFQAVAR